MQNTDEILPRISYSRILKRPPLFLFFEINTCFFVCNPILGSYMGGQKTFFPSISNILQRSFLTFCSLVKTNCHSLVLILILISIKTRIDNIFGLNHPPPPTTTTRNSTLLNIAQTIDISGYSSKQKLIINTRGDQN